MFLNAIARYLQIYLANSNNINELTTILNNAVYEANDLINLLNDQHQRRQCDRMGTTVVMGLVSNSKMYLANVGDSRAYLITRHGCYQLTIDDNTGTRLVQSGKSFYRKAREQLAQWIQQARQIASKRY